VNLSTDLLDDLQRLLTDIGPLEQARALFHHVLAIGHSPTYLTENEHALWQDWPRIPLPSTRETLLASAELGRRVAALLDTEEEVHGVTAGDIRPELRSLGVFSLVPGHGLNEAEDLAVTAGWGHGGRDGITMPGRGKAEGRARGPEEETALAPLGEQALELLGSPTWDIYLNAHAFWRNVPDRVWTYTLGGYQVLKKWLSYRELSLLGRPLTLDEARYVTAVVRRIAALLLLGPDLDRNYLAVKAEAEK